MKRGKYERTVEHRIRKSLAEQERMREKQKPHEERLSRRLRVAAGRHGEVI